MWPRNLSLLLIVAALFIAATFTPATAIGISPSSKEIQYEAGKEIKLLFTAINNGNEPASFDVYVEGELADNVVLEKNTLLLKPQSARAFSAAITMPEGLDPGTHGVRIGIIERSRPGFGTVSGQASVMSNIDVVVPFFGKFLKAKLSATTVNLGEPVDFALEVRNLGNETINSIGSTITIFEGNDKVGFADINTINNFGKFGSTTLATTWEPTKSGDFVAVADVIYDGLAAQAKAKFRVGRILINIVDITYDEIFAGAIGKIYVKLESKSNSKIDSVFTELFIYKDGEFLTRINGKPFLLLPWDIYTDTIYFDSKGFEPGVYDGKIIVHYGDRSAEQAFKLALRNRKAFDMTVYIIIVVLAISAVLLSIVYSRRGRKKR